MKLESIRENKICGNVKLNVTTYYIGLPQSRWPNCKEYNLISLELIILNILLEHFDYLLAVNSLGLIMWTNIL